MKLVGVVGGSIGADPFGRRTWSGSARFLFRELESQSLLARAFGVSVAPLWRCALLLRNFQKNRRIWRRQFYMDPWLCSALTNAAGARIGAEDYSHSFFQIGAQINLPRLVAGRTRCFSYHDGNIVEAMRAAEASQGISRARIDAAIAWERDVYHRMTRIFTMSEYLRSSFIRDFGVPEDRVVTVGAGINMETVPPPTRSERSYDTEEVLFIGVEFERKGGRELLRAFERVSARRPKARLHIVGPRVLPPLPGSLGRCVVHHGYIDKSTPDGAARLQRLFESASLLVLPSLYEPFGIVPLEAMAHGVPCIVSNGWALREMVTPDVNGDLVAVGNVDDLADKLEAHLRAPDRLRRWGQAGRTRVLERYTWKRVAQRIGEGIQVSASSRSVT